MNKINEIKNNCANPSLYPSQKKPYVHYADQGFWETKINFINDSSSKCLKNHVRAKKNKIIYSDLDHLCRAEIKKRFPNQTFTEHKFKKLQKEAAYSAWNCKDLICQITPSKKILKKTKIPLSALKTRHFFLKNSTLNGNSFRKDKKIIRLSTAFTSSYDFLSKNTLMARKILSSKESSICYTGRPNTEPRAKELGKMVFFEELHGKQKGIQKISSLQSHSR
ncbi:MAG: hypothetical protein ACM3JI_06040, partial [Anaerolineae bacterium]